MGPPEGRCAEVHQGTAQQLAVDLDDNIDISTRVSSHGTRVSSPRRMTRTPSTRHPPPLALLAKMSLVFSRPLRRIFSTDFFAAKFTLQKSFNSPEDFHETF